MKGRFRLQLLAAALAFAPGCTHSRYPPVAQSPFPPPTIYVLTSNTRVAMSPAQAAAYEVAAERGELTSPSYAESNDALPRTPVLDALSQPKVPVEQFGPVNPQYYYVRPEHTSTGYIEGHYGQVDNFMPGEHTSRGYMAGHYRGDGAQHYTRPEHTSGGYIEGHYRAEPVPFGQPFGTVPMLPAATPPPSFDPRLGK